MSEELWSAADQTPDHIDINILKTMANAGSNDEPDTSILDDTKVSKYFWVMKKDLGFWQHHAEALTIDEILHLMRFFTLAEAANQRWQAGEKSPVIHLNKLRKQRGEKLDKDTLRWIKSRSDNQFLPNGPITF